ncbi:nucleotidyltransferase substrate binding protein [Thioalkalivibrio sp. HK1]|uniref:nucleotidyltransferase substrate binding protein n=1 Tax=Thioalkalivibrio sp. HK1 TaxID=1469245 RepID=UPI0018CC5395|nr:nucleotidyltransferase substrate binding protein [Thioalkalivibrio sp. HK1]
MSEFAVDYAGFEIALKNLERYHEICLMQKEIGDDPDFEEITLMAEIKSFEICYATLLKALHRHLTWNLGAVDLGYGAKPIFREADRNGLLEDGAEHWFGYIEARNITSHEYVIEKIGRFLELIPVFITDAIKLYEKMTGAPWKSK